jgi:hypothetical protein
MHGKWNKKVVLVSKGDDKGEKSFGSRKKKNTGCGAQ